MKKSKTVHVTKAKIIFGLIFLVLFSGLGLVYWYFSSLTPTGMDSSGTQSFTIAKNESAASILTRLQNENLIRSSLAAKIYLKVSNQDKKLSPGAYELTPGLTTPQVLSQLFLGSKNVWVTIPEGWRREQIAARFASVLGLAQFDPDEFITKTADLEGQLYPDTYLVPPEITTAQVIDLLKKTFSQKTGLQSPDPRTLIIASLVEREVNKDVDRPIVAGIISKRLLSDWPLQIDATIQYAVGSVSCAENITECDWWQPVTDVNFPSEFNTYLHPGLPPAPICNPGLAAIKAAENPSQTEYWYYITGNDGITYYAKTLQEHNQNIDKHLRP